MQDLDQQALAAAEVVVDLREVDARLLGHRARARAGVPVRDQHLPRRIDDPLTRRLRP